jgi:hypothetical protein
MIRVAVALGTIEFRLEWASLEALVVKGAIR